MNLMLDASFAEIDIIYVYEEGRNWHLWMNVVNNFPGEKPCAVREKKTLDDWWIDVKEHQKCDSINLALFCSFNSILCSMDSRKINYV